MHARVEQEFIWPMGLAFACAHLGEESKALDYLESAYEERVGWRRECMVKRSVSEPEVWLRGPIPDIPPYLQPVAHSLLQCRAEVRATLDGLSRELIWTKPGTAASAGYHVRHAIGSLGRLLTYARGEQLSAEQMVMLRSEGDAGAGPASAEELTAAFDEAVEMAFVQLRSTDETTLLDAREVGRGKLPSTVIGLLFHGAEHTQRHVGQLVTTARIILSELSPPPVGEGNAYRDRPR